MKHTFSFALTLVAFCLLLALSAVGAYGIFAQCQHFQTLVERDLYPHAYYLLALIVIGTMILISSLVTAMRIFIDFILRRTNAEGTRDGKTISQRG